MPVEKDKWIVDPWAAVVKDGKIYGRGTQDMKSVGAQYLDAVVRCTRPLAPRCYTVGRRHRRCRRSA